MSLPWLWRSMRERFEPEVSRVTWEELSRDGFQSLSMREDDPFLQDAMTFATNLPKSFRLRSSGVDDVMARAAAITWVVEPLPRRSRPEGGWGEGDEPFYVARGFDAEGPNEVRRVVPVSERGGLLLPADEHFVELAGAALGDALAGTPGFCEVMDVIQRELQFDMCRVWPFLAAEGSSEARALNTKW